MNSSIAPCCSASQFNDWRVRECVWTEPARCLFGCSFGLEFLMPKNLPGVDVYSVQSVGSTSDDNDVLVPLRSQYIFGDNGGCKRRHFFKCAIDVDFPDESEGFDIILRENRLFASPAVVLGIARKSEPLFS